MANTQNNYSFDTKDPVFNVQIVKEEKPKPTTPITNSISVNNMTLALDHHFKLSIAGLIDVDSGMKLDKVYGKFLPIESMSLVPVSVSHTTLNIGIFSELPILSKRRMGSLKITLYDNVHNAYERAIVNWFNGCYNDNNGCVKPLGSIIREAHYIEYTNKGVQSKNYTFYIIPEGEVSVSRDYSGSKFKTVSFNTIIVGNVTVN